MREIFITLACGIIMILALPSRGQETAPGEKEKVIDLDRMADDMKYENAVQFIRLKLYDKALEELQEYLEVFINGNHRPGAYRQVAEIYFQRFDYQKTVKVYRALFEEFNNSEEGVEGYYNMGICYKKMGYDKKALEVFQRIVSDYPGSSFVSQAQLQLDLFSILDDKQGDTGK